MAKGKGIPRHSSTYRAARRNGSKARSVVLSKYKKMKEKAK